MHRVLQAHLVEREIEGSRSIVPKSRPGVDTILSYHPGFFFYICKGPSPHIIQNEIPQ